MRISEIDQHILEHESMPEAPVHLTGAGFRLFNICKAYKKVRPVIVFAKSLLFWKPKWVVVINLFIEALDNACME